MRTGSLNRIGTQLTEQLKRDFPLGVPPLTSCRSVCQCIEYGGLWYGFKNRPLAQMVLPQRAPEVPPQKAAIGEEPRLHDLNHEERLVIGGTGRTFPTVAGLQVLPNGMAFFNRVLAVNEQKRERSTARMRDGRCEEIERLCAPLATNNARQLSDKSGRLKEPLPPLSKQRIQQLALAATFDVKLHFHQRFPPNSPLLQRSPSVYLSSQALSSSASRRSSLDSPPSLEHTTTL